MEPNKPQKVVLLILAGMVTGAWGLIIWIATIVTRTMIDTLTLIVDLAAISP